jgi:hypothetical protein
MSLERSNGYRGDVHVLITYWPFIIIIIIIHRRL